METTLPAGAGFLSSFCTHSRGHNPLIWGEEKKSSLSGEEMHMYDMNVTCKKKPVHVLVVCNSVFGGTRQGGASGKYSFTCSHGHSIQSLKGKEFLPT